MDGRFATIKPVFDEQMFCLQTKIRVEFFRRKTMKKKVLAMSLLTIALCASLIVGATFAFFANKSSVDVPVNAGALDI